MFQFIKEEIKQKKRPKKSLIDSTNIDTQRGSKMSKYSGKYHNYCVKFTIIISEKGKLIDFSLNKGTESDSKIFDEMLSRIEKLPYEIAADKGYEKYERRRELKRKNCQLRIEMKKTAKNKKRGRRFLFTKEHKAQRSQVERFFAYLKTYKIFRLFRFRKISALKMALYVAIILVFIIS